MDSVAVNTLNHNLELLNGAKLTHLIKIYAKAALDTRMRYKRLQNIRRKLNTAPVATLSVHNSTTVLIALDVLIR
jgi:hypothetical protein